MDLKKFVDERGFFAEVGREDWKDFFGDKWAKQVNLTYSYPGMIRGWHHHSRGQIDNFVCLKGSLKVVVFDSREGSKTKGELNEFVLSSEKLQILRVPGNCWHATRAVGDTPALSIYLVSNMYDYKKPDEQKRVWNSNKIIDPKTGKPYDWDKPPHK